MKTKTRKHKVVKAKKVRKFRKKAEKIKTRKHKVKPKRKVIKKSKDFHKRSLAAKKAWKRRKKAEKKRSLAAKKGWLKRKDKEKQKQLIEKQKQVIEKQKRVFIRPKIEVIPELEVFEKKKEKTPEDYLINDPEFALERARMIGMGKYLEKALQDFADGRPFQTLEKRKDGSPIILNPPTVSLKLDTGYLADGSVIVQATFSDYGDDFDDIEAFTLMLEEFLGTFGPMFRVSVFSQWDPSRIAKPINIQAGEVDGKPGYDFYKGKLDIAQNVSHRMNAAFETLRGQMLPDLHELTGSYPDALGVRIVWGESVMRLSRLAVKV